MSTTLNFYEKTSIGWAKTSLFNGKTITIREVDVSNGYSMSKCYYDLHDDCRKWLDQKKIKFRTISGDQNYFAHSRVISIIFENEKDAMLFKMRFG